MIERARVRTDVCWAATGAVTASRRKPQPHESERKDEYREVFNSVHMPYPSVPVEIVSGSPREVTGTINSSRWLGSSLPSTLVEKGCCSLGGMPRAEAMNATA